MNQRPIEFRVWHKPTQHMYEVAYFTPDYVYLPWDESKTDADNYKVVDHPFNRIDCILLQFTGRVDQAGTKIWEGDVLRLDVMWAGGLPEGEEEYSCYYHVLFHNGGFALLPVGYQDPTDNWHVSFLTDYANDLHFIRVGSQYEHPELLQLTETYPLHSDHIRNHDQQSKTQPAA